MDSCFRQESEEQRISDHHDTSRNNSEQENILERVGMTLTTRSAGSLVSVILKL